ncbi:MAG TPA: peptidase MA domain-containing protein [Dehalococcoidia bacterium]|jgi:hypothetical protein|nr:peptidase MA domain-containing protein [Dehalococcoidia bacterium]
MIKKIGLLALILGLFLVVLGPASVQAEEGLAVRESSVEVDFPLKLTFNLKAQSHADITEIRLHYTVERESFAYVVSEVYLEFEPAPVVEVAWSWDMRKTGGLPPGSRLEYWWTLEDARGDRLETEPARVKVDDDRYSWRSLTEGKVTIHWYQGDESFARELMGVAQEALLRLAKSTGAELARPVNIYIYAGAQDLQGAMIFPQEWTGGVTFTRYSTIAIGIAPDEIDWGRRAMAHELTHLVIHQVVFNPYSDLPTWLDEGIAMYAEGPLEPAFAALLEKAIREGSLISVRSLASPFSALAEQSALAYAQSYSLVKFLIENYGQSQMLELLRTFREGSGYDQALLKVYGFDVDGLDSLWRSYPLKY